MQGSGRAYYNECEPYAAQWLRNLIDEGHVARGTVDDRSIRGVRAGDLADRDQCHFFAGIGIWSAALRRAGWPDDVPVWTGSCPCQPFSIAGRRHGFADDRHLWPVWFDLIRERRPYVVLGEQVASRDGLAWLDTVSDQMEGEDYAVGAVDTCAAGVGAPHIRQRMYWTGIAAEKRLAIGKLFRRILAGKDGTRARQTAVVGGDALRVADALHTERRAINLGNQDGCDRKNCRRKKALFDFGTRCQVYRLADAAGEQQFARWLNSTGEQSGPVIGLARSRPDDGLAKSNGAGRHQGRQAAETSGHGDPAVANGGDDRAGPVNGVWRNADWLLCRDGKWRAVESGTQPLAHGYPARVGRLRAYGNALCLPQAAAFVRAVMEELASA